MHSGILIKILLLIFSWFSVFFYLIEFASICPCDTNSKRIFTGLTFLDVVNDVLWDFQIEI